MCVGNWTCHGKGCQGHKIYSSTSLAILDQSDRYANRRAKPEGLANKYGKRLAILNHYHLVMPTD